MTMTKVSTAGGSLDLARPMASEVDFLHVAAALGKLCRFAGHTRSHYSVAEHSVRLADAVKRSGAPQHVQLQALLHDAAEAYTGDITRPMRAAIEAKSVGACDALEQIERSVWEAVCYAADITPHLAELVVRLDNEACAWERRHLVGSPDDRAPAVYSRWIVEAWEDCEPFDTWAPPVASRRWLDELVRLLPVACG